LGHFALVRDGAGSDYQRMATRALAGLALLLVTLVASAPAFAFTPRVAISGRVISFVDVVPPADRIVRLGTQEPRRLSLGSQVPVIGQEICIWGTDVENTPSASDPAPMGIVGYAIAPVASIGCADVVTTTSASFVMPGERGSPLPNPATLTLQLSKPAGAGCVRIAIDAAGNPVAVVVPRAVSAPVPAPPPGVSSLPGTSAGDDRVLGAFIFAAGGAIGAAVALIVRRRRRRAIPS
jgi:hypothetical protein